MGLPVEVNPLFLENQYAIQRSLRFRASASAYLNRTFGTPTSQNTWTLSFWLKRGALSTQQTLFSAGTSNRLEIILASNNTLQIADASTNFIITTSVYRDVSSWYHIVIRANGSGSAMQVYVNGVITTNTTTNNLTTSYWNASGVVNYIGSLGGFSSNYLDGYLAEINFVDGQSLAPTTFGQYNEFGVWSPRKYGGSYGTNGFYLPFLPNTTSTYALYQPSIPTDYIGFPTGSQGTNFTFTGDFTIEGWVYFPSASSGDNSFYVQADSGVTTYLALNISMTAGIYNIYLNSAGVSNTISHGLTANTWNHVAMVRSGSTITLYTNGVSKGTITNSATLGYSTLGINRIGGGTGGARYTSNFRITKSAVYTSSFTPPTSPLTAIANTVILTCQNATAVDNSGNAYTTTIVGSATLGVQYPFGGPNIIGNDASGNGNNWASNNISLSVGTTYDAMTDVPPPSTIQNVRAGNYATLNPLSVASAITLSDANLTAASSAGGNQQRVGTLAVSSGKWYFEVNMTFIGAGAGDSLIGVSEIINNTSYTSQFPGQASTSYAAYCYSANTYIQTYNNNTATNTNISPPVTGDIISVAVDLTNGKIWFAKNNTWTSSGDPANGLNPAYSFTPASGSGYTAAVRGGGGGGTVTMGVNFGQRPFSYTPPSGFLPLNSNNLPAPTIPNGAKVMAAVTYNGTGAAGPTQIITSTTNSGNNPLATTFQPDFVWTKGRGSATYNNHLLFDVIRGATKLLQSNQTVAEGTASNSLTSFNANGFSIGSFDDLNTNGNTYISWQWLAGGSPTPNNNTDGSITSTVSVNKSAGFSVVTYTGTGANATVGHGLGVAPSFIIFKNRSSVLNWIVYTSTTGAGNVLFLDATNASTANTTAFNNTSPTPSVFSVGAYNNTNQSTNNLVAYCWTPIAGYSSFGSYTGNSSADGPFIYTGFRPRWIMIKRIDAAGYDWPLIDSSRSSYNMQLAALYADLSNAEASGADGALDILSNGFKIRTNAAGNLNSSGTYIYAAFAENPFKLALAR